MPELILIWLSLLLVLALLLQAVFSPLLLQFIIAILFLELMRRAWMLHPRTWPLLSFVPVTKPKLVELLIQQQQKQLDLHQLLLLVRFAPSAMQLNLD